MNYSHVRAVFSSIIIVGHILIFFGALALGLFGPLRGQDLVQVALMGSPILALVATSAVRAIIDNTNTDAKHHKAGILLVSITFMFPIGLICCILFLFWAVYRQYDGFGPNELKVGLGAVETFFGGFLGMLSDKFFYNPSSAKIDLRQPE